MSGCRARPVRVARVITRLNIGGPARHVTILSTRLGPEFETRLFIGLPSATEGSLLDAARDAGADVVVLPELRREPAPLADLRALWKLTREFRAWRPDVVATHTAKAGMLGRLAAVLAGVPVRVHTFHGHVLHGYFGPLGSAGVRLSERLLARLSTQLIAVSPEIAGDLAGAGIGRDRTTVIPLGLDLAGLAKPGRSFLRGELGLEDAYPVIGLVGRLVPIKAPELFLEAARRVLQSLPGARFVLVGDGQLRERLEAVAAEPELRGRVVFTGWRSDLAEVFAAIDVVVCCSLNEGTPVSVIEAGAAGKPVVGTRVGGMPSVIREGATGLLVPAGDAGALAAAIVGLASDPDLMRRLGSAAAVFVRERHSSQVMVREIRDLYTRLLAARLASGSAAMTAGG